MISDKMVEAAFRSEMPDALSRVISRRHIRALLTAALSAASCNCPGEGRPAASGVDTSTNEAWATRAQEKIAQMAAASVSERARHILADAYRDAGFTGAVDDALSDTPSPHCAVTLRAIEQALTQQRDTTPQPSADAVREVPDGDHGLAEFTEYFVKNYPGPDTIIYAPEWHAPRIFRAARRAMLSAASGEKGVG